MRCPKYPSLRDLSSDQDPRNLNQDMHTTGKKSRPDPSPVVKSSTRQTFSATTSTAQISTPEHSAIARENVASNKRDCKGQGGKFCSGIWYPPYNLCHSELGTSFGHRHFMQDLVWSSAISSTSSSLSEGSSSWSSFQNWTLCSTDLHSLLTARAHLQKSVLRIRIRIHMFLGLLDPDPAP